MSKAFEKFLEQSKKDGLTLYPGPLHNAAYVAWNAAIEHAAKICQEAAASCAISADAASTLDDRLECLTEQAAFLSAEMRIRKEKTE